MRVEQTERGMVVINEAGLIGKLLTVVLAFAGLLSVGIFLGSFVLPPRTVTMTCNRQTRMCVLPGPHGVKLPVDKLNHFEVRRGHGAKNRGSGFTLSALMNDGVRVELSQRIHQSDHRDVLVAASDELNRFVEDQALSETIVTYVDVDTDRGALGFLGGFSLLTAWALARLWRRVRTEVDAATRTVRVTAKRVLRPAVDESFSFSAVTKVEAFSGGQRGWASVSLQLRTGRTVELLRVPRTGNVRKQLATLLPALGSTLGVEVTKNEGYREAWDAT